LGVEEKHDQKRFWSPFIDIEVPSADLDLRKTRKRIGVTFKIGLKTTSASKPSQALPRLPRFKRGLWQTRPGEMEGTEG